MGIKTSLKALVIAAMLSTTCHWNSNTTMHAKPVRPVIRDQAYTMVKEKDNPVTRYAVILVGSKLEPKEKYDAFWVNSTYIYGHLEDLNFKPENIFYLYIDGNPDFKETMNSDTIKRIKKHHFKDRNKSKATNQNLERIINQLSKKIDKNDIFVLTIGTHGFPESLEMQGNALTPKNLRRMLHKVRPGYGLLYLDACYGGAFIYNTHAEDYTAVASTTERTMGLVGAYFSGSRTFFENLSDPQSDVNLDRKITVNEAYDRSVIESWIDFKRMKEHLPKDVKKKLKQISVRPMIRVGRYSSDTFYFIKMGIKTE